MIQILLYLSLAWLPFDRLFEFEVGIVTFTGYYVAIISLFIIAAVQLIQGKSRFAWTAIDSAVAAVCFLYLPSTLLSSDYITAGFLAFRGIFIPTLTYLVVRILLQTEQQVRRAILSFCAGVILLTAAGLLEFLVTNIRPEPFGRDAVSVATMSVLPLMCGLYAGNHFAGRKLRALLIVGGALGVAVSFTRAYWVFVAFSPLFFRMFMRRKAFLLISAFLVATLLATLVITSQRNLVSRPTVEFGDTRGINRVLSLDHWRLSMYERVVFMYQPSIDAFLESPLFGNGLMVHKGQETTTHNLHLEWLESGGVFGYLAFSAIYLIHFAQLSRRGRADPLLCAMGLATFAVLVNGVTNGIMHSIMPTCVMVNLGLVSAYMQLGERSHHSSMDRDRRVARLATRSRTWRATLPS